MKKKTKKTKKAKRGFTLIELLVVIAVIGILAGIVLVSVRKAPDAAKDARIKSAITQVRDIAQMQYIDTNAFDSVCNGAVLNDAIAELKIIGTDVTTNGGAVVCHATTSGYCVYSAMKTDPTKYFCVDSAGAAREATTTATDCSEVGKFTCATD